MCSDAQTWPLRRSAIAIEPSPLCLWRAIDTGRDWGTLRSLRRLAKSFHNSASDRNKMFASAGAPNVGRSHVQSALIESEVHLQDDDFVILASAPD